MTKANLVEMEVFRTGDYGPKGSYTESDLDSIAADYRPDLLEAPLTFDHAQTGPAFGWVSRLRREGDRLIAAFKGVPQTVMNLMKMGAYKRRSVELFRALPHTGRPYLRAVSLLGAATPEVKGLRDICFASKENAVALEFSAADGAEADCADAAVDVTVATVTDKAGDVTPAEERLAALFSELREEGYCLSDADAAGLQALYAGEATDVDAGLDCLGRMLRGSLLRAPLAEQGGGAEKSTVFAHDVADMARFGDRVSRESVVLHHGALQIMAAEPSLPYREALLRAAR